MYRLLFLFFEDAEVRAKGAKGDVGWRVIWCSGAAYMGFGNNAMLYMYIVCG